MKKLLLLLLVFTVLCFSAYAQDVQNVEKFESTETSIVISEPDLFPPGYAPDITWFIGPTVQASALIVAAGPELGGLVGISFKNQVQLGYFYQSTIKYDDYQGVYTQWTANPTDRWFHVGFSLKVGVANGKYIMLDPALETQSVLNDWSKLAIAMGFAYGFPSVQVRFLVGDFRPTFWRNHHMTKKLEQMRLKEPSEYEMLIQRATQKL